MKYNHAVKYNGVIYPTGTDVPVEDTKDDSGAKADGEEKTGDKVEGSGETNADPNEEATKEPKADEKSAKNK